MKKIKYFELNKRGDSFIALKLNRETPTNSFNKGLDEFYISYYFNGVIIGESRISLLWGLFNEEKDKKEELENYIYSHYLSCKKIVCDDYINRDNYYFSKIYELVTFILREDNLTITQFLDDNKYVLVNLEYFNKFKDVGLINESNIEFLYLD